MGRQTGRLRSPFLLDVVIASINKNMNILLIGDSWAWPISDMGKEYSNIEASFLKRGHLVYNKSMFGCSNIWTLDTARSFVFHASKLINFDLVVWLYTDLTRDKHLIQWDKVNGYNDCLNNLHEQTHAVAMDIRKMIPKAKWAIIGGNAPIYKHEEYDWVDFLIEDWRSELIGTTLPKSQCLYNIEWLAEQKNTFGLDVLENELEKYETIMNATKANDKIFFDGYHPDNYYNQTLVERISDFFKI